MLCPYEDSMVAKVPKQEIPKLTLKEFLCKDVSSGKFRSAIDGYLGCENNWKVSENENYLWKEELFSENQEFRECYRQISLVNNLSLIKIVTENGEIYLAEEKEGGGVLYTWTSTGEFKNSNQR